MEKTHAQLVEFRDGGSVMSYLNYPGMVCRHRVCGPPCIFYLETPDDSVSTHTTPEDG